VESSQEPGYQSLFKYKGPRQSCTSTVHVMTHCTLSIHLSPSISLFLLLSCPLCSSFYLNQLFALNNSDPEISSNRFSFYPSMEAVLLTSEQGGNPERRRLGERSARGHTPKAASRCIALEHYSFRQSSQSRIAQSRKRSLGHGSTTPPILIWPVP